MGILTRIFTGSTQRSEVSRKEFSDLWYYCKELSDAHAETRKALDKALDTIDELRSEHRKLRGRFYAARGEVEAAPAETKADVLRRIGYIPGRPAPHR